MLETFNYWHWIHKIQYFYAVQDLCMISLCSYNYENTHCMLIRRIEIILMFSYHEKD